jgi:hypothetical protein
VNKRSSHRLSLLVAVGLSILATGCTGLLNTKLFKERASETPAPNEQIVDKSFFVDASGKPKTFLCAWAPEIGRGELGEEQLTPLVDAAEHCNVEWEVTENYLIAKRIDPSFPDDRTRWAEALKIPIEKHFYYEREKDAHGRETNRWIENDQRSHWSARPKMRLNLSAINIGNLGVGAGWGHFDISSVDDVEWDLNSNFLGFSINTVYRDFLGTVQDYQGRFRVNFLQFQHNPNFKKVPYHQENSRYLNALHILGRKIEGVEQELYVGHWDLSKPITVYISGVPQALQQTVKDAVNKWNVALADAQIVPKGSTPFIPQIANLKHPFDLRYPTMNYISDRRISEYAPLGVGEAVADVTNGQIFWGSVTMFGGALEGYINAYVSSSDGDSSAAGSAASSAAFSPFAAFTSMLPSSFLPLQLASGVSRSDLLRNFTTDHMNFLGAEIKRLSENPKDSAGRDQLTALRDQLVTFQSNNPNLNKIVADILQSAGHDTAAGQEYFRGHTIQSLLGSAGLAQSQADSQLAAASHNDAQIAAILAEKSADKRRDMVKALSPRSNTFFMERDFTLEKVGAELANDPARRNRTYPEMLESVVMHLALHEFGHFMGQGHQFKENIVPDKGSVPSSYVNDLSAKATAANEFAEETSVMGYRHGRTEMMVPASELKPGPHDDLVLRYLYTGKYAAYDSTSDAWAYGDVPTSGKIPDWSMLKGKDGQMHNMSAAYFPQCNDMDATFNLDPFCNRWDRGTTAQDIVKSYFGYISNNLLHSLYSLTGGGANADLVQNHLWYMALEQFSRVRIFYDEMRRRLRTDPKLVPHWNRLRGDKDSLLEFSAACQKDDRQDPKQVRSSILRDLFAADSDGKLVDLCRANALALREFSFFLNLPAADYTKIDNANRYISGGVFGGDAATNYGHMFGSWYQMSNLPLKYTALEMLTTANPPMLFGPYLLPNFSYDTEENRYLYRTLYPREYTRMISDTVQHNMRFAATGTDDTTTMGRSILALGGLLQMQKYSNNESARLPSEFNKLLDQQNQFSYGMAAVMIDAPTPDPSEKVATDHYKKFTATIYDFFTGKNATARDVFILRKGQVLVWKNGMFLYPITRLKFYENQKAYVIAYRVDYDYEEGDELVDDSVKTALTEQHDYIMATCVNGFSGNGSSGNGLINFFGNGAANKDKDENCDPTQRDHHYCSFKGFYIPPGIATEIGKEKMGQFYQSIEDAFYSYEGLSNSAIPKHYPIQNMSTICDEAVRGVGEISAAAALINGYWLEIAPEYIDK